MRARRKHMATIPGEWLQMAPKKRNMCAKRLALTTGTAPSNISHCLTEKIHPEVLDILAGSARELNVSADYLSGPYDEEDPTASEKKEMTDFKKCFGYLMGDGDFLMIAGYGLRALV